MQEQRTPVRAGQQVYVRDESWVVVDEEHFGQVTLLTLRGTDEGNRGATQQFLTPFDRVRPALSRTRLSKARRLTVLSHAAGVIAASPRWRDCWTAGTAAIDLRPWQIEPVLGVIGGTTRMLLADDAGLGKTVQAALIISELMARSLAHRVLILSPASLRAQWATELWDKFRIATTVFDHASLAAAAAALPIGVNPWRTAPVMISSIDLVKRPELRSALDEVPLDILVVDEAHHATPGTDRGAAVADLAARTTWVVLATATPHSGDQAAFQFLEALGSVGDTSSLVMYRRATIQVRGAASRRSHLLGVRPTRDERALLDATAAYCQALCRSPTASPGLTLVASVMARRAASSAAAAKRTFERRLALLEGSALPVAQAPLPWEEDADDEEMDDRLALPGLSGRAEELVWLRRLVELAHAAEPVSSKVRIIRRLLTRTNERLIVFSEYRDVVREVAARIADLVPVVLIHGGVAAAVAAISSPPSPEANGASGDNRRCRRGPEPAGAVPARSQPGAAVESPAAGAADRPCRSHWPATTSACHQPVHRESFEDVVLAYLERRRARATSAVRNSSASVSIADLETERRLRMLGRRQPQPQGEIKPLYACRGPQLQPPFRVILLFCADVVDATSRVVERQLIPIALGAPLRGGVTRKLAKEHVRDLAENSAVRAALARELDSRVGRVRRDAAQTALALERRVRAMLTDLEQRRRSAPFQGSLFDRRTRATGANSGRCPARLATPFLPSARQSPIVETPTHDKAAVGGRLAWGVMPCFRASRVRLSPTRSSNVLQELRESPADRSDPVVLRSLHRWWNRVATALGPASSARAVLDIGALPLVDLLGFGCCTSNPA